MYIHTDYIYVYTQMIYMYTYIYINTHYIYTNKYTHTHIISSSSASSNHTDGTYFPEFLSPSVLIIHQSQQVFQITSCVCTELM